MKQKKTFMHNLARLMNVTLRYLNYSIYHTFNSSASGKLTDLGKTGEYNNVYSNFKKSA